jgi:hypothetical protein
MFTRIQGVLSPSCDLCFITFSKRRHVFKFALHNVTAGCSEGRDLTHYFKETIINIHV